MTRGWRLSKSNQCKQCIEHYMNKAENLSDTLMSKTPQPCNQLKEQMKKEAQ